MFIRPKKPAPEPYVRSTLADLGYRIDPEDGKVRSIATGDMYDSGADKRRAAELYQSLAHPASREVYQIMVEGDLRMEPVAVPSSDQPHTSIYATPGALAKDKLVVIVVGHGTCGGVWASNVLLKSGIREGSVIDYVRACSERGLGVLVLNPNENIIAPDGSPEITNAYSGPAAAIEGSETADEHVGYVWSHLLRDGAASSVAFVAYNTGGISVVELLKYDYPRFVGKVAGIAYIDSMHSIFGLGDGSLAWLALGAKHWMTSTEPMGQPIANEYVGCPTVSVENTTDSREMTPAICQSSVVDYVVACLDRGPITDATALGDGHSYNPSFAAEMDGELGSESDDGASDAIPEALESVHLMQTQDSSWITGDDGAGDNGGGNGEGDGRHYVGWD